jgi:FixJ family two-component response regulator
MGKKINIVIVDDSISILKSLDRLITTISNELNIKNIHLEKYKNYTEFLKERKLNYDVAIIDWNLPDGKGKDVVKNLNGDCKYKVIYTGMIDDNMEIGTYCINTNIEYIPKGSDDPSIRNFIETKLRLLKGRYNG